MIEGVIYRYKSPSGKYYIGQTIDERTRRRNFLNIETQYGGSKIERARKKYGPENFEYIVLMKVTGDDPEEVKQYLNTLESGFIRMYDSLKNGYNSTEGGDGTIGYLHTEEWKKNYSEHIKGNKFNLGKTRTDETKKKISEALKGKQRSEESKEKNRLAHIGKTSWNKGLNLSEEHKKKLSDAHKGKPAQIKGKHRVYNPDGTYRMVK